MDQNSKSFNTHSDRYALSRPRYPQEFYRYLLSLISEKRMLWDCACGNGQVAIDLASYFDEVYATDISENQIKNAFQHPKINYSVTQSEHTSFAPEFFDMICVAQALHWFDLQAFFKEADRVLKPGGVLAVFGYGFFTIDEQMDQILDKFLYAAIDPFWSDRNRLLISGFQGVDFPFDKIETPEFSMDQQWDLKFLIAYLDTWSAVKLYNEKTGQEITTLLKEKLSEHWGTEEVKTVKMNIYSYIRRK